MCVSLSLFAAELPTPKSHYLQTNTIPMYEDDLFNQLGQANSELATPGELVLSLPHCSYSISHESFSLSLSLCDQPLLLYVHTTKRVTFRTAQPNLMLAHFCKVYM